jgi:hypothetical protein
MAVWHENKVSSDINLPEVLVRAGILHACKMHWKVTPPDAFFVPEKMRVEFMKYVPHWSPCYHEFYPNEFKKKVVFIIWALKTAAPRIDRRLWCNLVPFLAHNESRRAKIKNRSYF